MFLGESDTSADAPERRVRAQPAPAESAGWFNLLVQRRERLGARAAGQTVSGQSFEDYVQQHIFAPLVMRNTYLSPIEACTHGMAAGHRFWFGQPVALDSSTLRS